MTGMADTADTERVAVLAPDGNYGPHGPLLLFSAIAARRRGAGVRPVTWEPERGEVERFLDEVVCTTAEPAVS